MYLAYQYTDNRLPEGRTITMGAATVHARLVDGAPIKLEDRGAYEGWCAEAGVEAVKEGGPPARKKVATLTVMDHVSVALKPKAKPKAKRSRR